MSELDRLKDIVAKLRGPGGCPWDQEQTMASITPHIIEEAYELIDSIHKHNINDIKEELGDALLHIVMLAQMGSEDKQFDLEDIAKESADKMVRRHPHVFGDTKVNSVDQVWENWESIKKKEKENNKLFDSIPNHFPALLQAQKIQKKAAREGFDWHDMTGPLEKLEEEIQEFKNEVSQDHPNMARCHDEFGDILFALVNIARKLNIQSEESLKACNKRFMTRYYIMEALVQKDQKELKKMTLEELDTYWEKAKTQSQ